MTFFALGPASSVKRPPAGHDRRLPAHAVERFHHLSRRTDIADEEKSVRTGILQTRELRDHIDVVAFELLDSGRLDADLLQGRAEPVLVRFAPWIVDENQARLLRAMGLHRVFDHRLVDRLIHCGDPEGVVRVGAVMGDVGARGPRVDEGDLGAVGEWHDSERDGRIEPSEQDGDFLTLDQLARSDYSLGRVGLIVAAHELDLTSENAALCVDLIDRDRESARQCLARTRGLPGQRSHETDLDRLGRLCGPRREQGETKRSADSECGSPRKLGDSRRSESDHGVVSPFELRVPEAARLCIFVSSIPAAELTEVSILLQEGNVSS
jgi:hypothetical protein